MRLNKKGAIEILGLLIFTALQVIVLKGAEHYHKNRPSSMIKIETNDSHDANTLPPGVRIGPVYNVEAE